MVRLGGAERAVRRRHGVPMGWMSCLLLLLAGCATAPPSPAPTPPPAPAPAQPAQAAPVTPPKPAIPAIQISRLICTVQEARRVPFADLGLPAGSRPVDLALGKDRIWILFEPSLLVGLPRAAGAAPVAVAEYGAVEEVEMIPGPQPDAWRSVSVDPLDGTLWLASPAGLWRRRSGRRPELVTITDGSKMPAEAPEKRPAGKRAKKPAPPPLPVIPVPPGGFRSVVATRGTVWAAPACADHALWKLDSQGRRLAADLPVPAEPCTAADLQRDWSGDVLALSPAGDGALLRPAAGGSWQPAGDALTVPLPLAADGPLGAWFFWGPEPLSLGGSAADARLYRHDGHDGHDGRVGGKVTAFHEDCGPGNALVRVAGDARGWVALTRDWLLIGEHQRIEPRQEPGSH